MDDLDDLELLRRLRDGERAEREAAFAALHRRHARRSFQLAWRVLGDADLAADAVQEAFLTVWRKGARFEERAQFSSWLFRVVLNRSIDLRRKEQRGERGRGAPTNAPGGGRSRGAASQHLRPAGDAPPAATAPGAPPTLTTASSSALSSPSPAARPPVGGSRAPGGGAGTARAAGSAGEEAPDPLAQVASRDPGPEAVARAAERDEALWRAVARLSPKLEEVVLLRYSTGLSYEEIGALLGLPPGTVRSRLNRAHAALRGLLGDKLDVEASEFP